MIDISARIRNANYSNKIKTAEEAAALIQPDDKVGISGFSPAGYPKAVPMALAKRIGQEHFKVDIWSGAATGDQIDGELGRVNGINRRYPYQDNKLVRTQINSGSVLYSDIHLSHMAQMVRYGFLGQLDWVVFEAVAITEDGNLIPSTAVGNSATYVSQAKHVIVEINVKQPLSLEGMHDIYEPQDPPFRKPIPVEHAGDRIGTTYVPCGWDKIAAIVPCDIEDTPRVLKPIDDDAKAMSQHLIEFFKNEIDAGRLPKNLLPLQSGVGSVANAVISGLVNSPFENLSIYTEVIQDGMLNLIDAGKVDVVSGTCMSVSPAGLKRFYDNIDMYRKKIIMRPQEIANNPEVIRRLGVIGMNTAIEFDIYGNVNSTHICGSKVMNGIGGAGDFARNSYLSIFCTSSIAKDGKISSVVPLCSHIDQTEHDIQVLCTEQGIADLRGLSPIERARVIIEHCAHPDYKDMLKDYLERAIQVTGSQHEPTLLDEALSWHQRFLDTGTMKK